MNTLRHRRRPVRSRTGRVAPRFDRLEGRLALSATFPTSPATQSGALSVVSVDPADGSTVARPPSEITVTFDRPIFGANQGDFRLDFVALDGSETTADEGSSLPESRGSGLDQVALTPGTPLGPGEYRLYIQGSSSLAAPGGADEQIDDFTVAATATVPTSAIDLGSPTSAGATASGALDLADDPGAVDYYKVELPRGHFWQLGVEVSAERIGSPLTSAITIYDAQGHAIRTSDHWDPSDPLDPYLFAGLNPGVYYIGVAGRTGTQAGVTATGGAYTLQVVADPADVPTVVTSAKLDYADPTEKVPTGLTLQFSAALDETELARYATGLVQIVDASGQTWAADATTYDATHSRLTFVFDQPLPAGRYSVELAGQGGLVDLLGRPPVAPGLPAGTLAQFTVPSTAPSTNPDNLGPVFLGSAESGVSARSTLAPGQEVTYRFVVTCAGLYNLETTYTGSAPTFTAHVGGAAISLANGNAGLIENHLLRLNPGVVTIDVRGGLHGTTIDWTYLLEGGSYDLLLDNGVGQASGLGLRLITPGPLDSPAGPSVAVGPVAPAVAGPGPAAAAAASSSSSTGSPAGSAPSGSAGTVFVANVAPVGHPGALDDAIAVVGPVAPGGAVALSSGAAGIPQGLASAFGRAARGARGLNSGAIRGLVEVPEPVGGGAEDGPVVEVAADLPPLPEVPSPAPAPAAAPAAGPVGRLSSGLAGLTPSRPGLPSPGRAPLDGAAPAASGGGPSHAAAPEVVEASRSDGLSGPLGLGFVALVATHSQRRFVSWLGRRKAPRLSARAGVAPSGSRRPIA